MRHICLYTLDPDLKRYQHSWITEMEVREGLDQLDLIGRALEKDRVGNGNMVDMDCVL